MKKYLILIILAFVFSCNQNLEIENNVNTWAVEQTETEKFHANMKVIKTGWASFWEIEELRWIFEEILIRFGLMTLLAWIFYKIFKKKNIWIFGFLYYKNGLESAMITHIVTHIILLNFT